MQHRLDRDQVLGTRYLGHADVWEKHTRPPVLSHGHILAGQKLHQVPVLQGSCAALGL